MTSESRTCQSGRELVGLERPTKVLLVRSVHFAEAPDRCNIHIDPVGFVVGGTAGEVIVDPDLAQRLVNELLWKATTVFPDMVVDGVSIMLPTGANKYSCGDQCGLDEAKKLPRDFN